MSVCLQQGQSAGPSDLTQVVYRSGAPIDPFLIEFQILESTTGVPVAMTSRTAATRSAAGQYYAAYTIPTSAPLGDWVVKWFIQEVDGGPEVEMYLKFSVVTDTTVDTLGLDSCTSELLRLIRIVLRDNNPDRNYHFSPPTRDVMVNTYTTRYGYIWEDEELIAHMQLAVMEANMRPPIGSFPDQLCQFCQGPYGFIPVIGGAASAVRALATNWIEEEFSYSIGGISLDISKASMYMQMKENLEGRFDKVVDDYLDKGGAYVVRGLSQGFYGMGFTAALGPSLREGVVSARSFVGRSPRGRKGR